MVLVYMTFAIPMEWHTIFCVTEIKGINSKIKQNVKHPHLLSSMRPIRHSETISVPHSRTRLVL